MKLNTGTLIEEVEKKLNYSLKKDDIKLISSLLFEEISKELINKNRIEIRGFGSFSIRTRNTPSDPRKNNGNSSGRKECNSVYFRMSKNIIDNLKEN